MTGRSVLFVGGTGIISASCVRRAVDLGWQVSVLNRGRSSQRAWAPVARITVSAR